MNPSIADFVSNEDDAGDDSSESSESEFYVDIKGDQNARVELLHAPPGLVCTPAQ